MLSKGAIVWQVVVSRLVKSAEVTDVVEKVKIPPLLSLFRVPP